MGLLALAIHLLALAAPLERFAVLLLDRAALDVPLAARIRARGRVGIAARRS
ncbi:MAG TPA: hypothetical protein VGK52_14320 [Polyangia bacterium]